MLEKAKKKRKKEDNLGIFKCQIIWGVKYF